MSSDDPTNPPVGVEPTSSERETVTHPRFVKGGKRRQLSPGMRRFLAEHLDDKRGHKCAMCGRECPIPYFPFGQGCILEQDHIDGDISHNELSNFRWLCKPCNIAQRNRTRPPAHSARQGEKAGMSEAGELAGESSEEMRVNVEWRPRFQAWVADRILHSGSRGPLTVKEAIRSGAQHIRNRSGNVHGSMVTTRRWLQEMTSKDEGVFEVYELKEVGPCVRFRWDSELEGASPPWEVEKTRRDT